VATKAYKDHTQGKMKSAALSEVSFENRNRLFVSFVGPSGSGKTTLLNLIGCLDKPTEGTLQVAGTDVFASGPETERFFPWQQYWVLFQDFKPHPRPYGLRKYRIPPFYGSECPGGVKGKRGLWHSLEAVGMSDQKGQIPWPDLRWAEAEGGYCEAELVTNPKLVLADEPTGEPWP